MLICFPTEQAAQQHSSEIVNLPLLQTPTTCIADFCLVPLGTSNPSVSAEIAEVQRLLKRCGLHFTMSACGTTVEGSWDDVTRIIGQAHSLLHGSGVARINTDIRISSRTDKKQSAQDKLNAVQAHLNNQPPPQPTDMDVTEPQDTEVLDADESETTELQNHSTVSTAAAANNMHQQLSHHAMQPANIPPIAPGLESMVPPNAPSNMGGGHPGGQAMGHGGGGQNMGGQTMGGHPGAHPPGQHHPGQQQHHGHQGAVHPSMNHLPPPPPPNAHGMHGHPMAPHLGGGMHGGMPPGMR